MKQTALISIHPEHIDNIMSGKKVFEYRKVLPKKDVSLLVLYCTAPVKKMMAVVEVLNRVEGSPSHVWKATSFGSGIHHRVYLNYYSDRKNASAFVLGNVYAIPVPMSLSELTGQKTPPRSFCYLNDADMKLILKRKSVEPVISPSVFFVGGVHGVGKSTLCKKVSLLGGYQHIAASSLINPQKERISPDKHVNNIANNQTLLLRNLELAKAKYCRVLLDGHFTLINKELGIEPVDVQIFNSMNLKELILIKDCPNRIASRLRNRDNKKWDISFVKKFQKEEEKHAKYVSEQIRVPLRVFNNDIRITSLARTIYRMP